MLKGNPHTETRRGQNPIEAPLEALAAENQALRNELVEARENYDALKRSLSWRITAPLRLAATWALRLTASTHGRSNPYEVGAGGPTPSAYREWIARYDTLQESDRQRIRGQIAALSQPPAISIILLARGAPADRIRETIDSIHSQLYPHWRIAVSGAHALESHAWDPRVRVLEADLDQSLADSDFAAFLEPGELLAETALFEVASAIAANPGAEMLYTDEDRLDAAGLRSSPQLKTGWNPDLLLTGDYIGSLAVYSRGLLARAGGLRETYGAAWRHDLALRASAATASAQILHIPAVLCHRHESAVVEDPAASRRAVAEHLESIPGAKVVEAPGAPTRHRILWPAAEPPVSIVVPTRDRADLLARCIDGLTRRTAYPKLEVLIMDNESREDATRRLFDRLCASPNVRVIPFPGAFNWSAINNAAADAVSHGVLVFLNNDTDVLDPDWLRELVRHAVRPEIGAAGAKLLFADRRVQHAGVWLGPVGRARHLLRLAGSHDPGYLNQLILARNFSAVTGACMAVRREVLREVGGFDTALPVSHGDIDFCLRLIEAGYRIVWTPYAELLHLECASRGSRRGRWREEESEKALFRSRWSRVLDQDPFFNPNLDLIGEEKLVLASPPRKPVTTYLRYKNQ